MTDRRHIADALRAMRGADLALCSYAETGDLLDLDTACCAARRLRSALASQRHQIRKENHTMAKKTVIVKKPAKGGKKSKPC
jgi:hypothetical protein